MSNTYNYGTIAVDNDGKLLIERGTQYTNFGTIENNGYISIDDGGSLHNDAGNIVNNGTVDLVTYFSGNDITGTGTVNDKR
ncbi:hypothetical protein SDC9_140528 [bioreactor metagenome]|uniref:Uncharacterized protein n=1 Tax=bioreactor metagenome TaxID=1076179 RepID=A0A645DVN3_9ZZZZ